MSELGGLSEQQARSIAQANGTVNVWEGAVRSGKTVASLLRTAKRVTEPNRPRQGLFVVSGKTLDTIKRNVFGPLSDPAIMGPAARLTHYTAGAPTGTLMGLEVPVISGNDARAEERLRGLTAWGWYADEVNLLPESFVDQLVARASVPGAQGYATCNPGAPNHWFKTRYIDKAWTATGPDIRQWHFTLRDNPGLTADYIETISALYSGVWYKRMVLGLWVMAEGAIFDAFDEERHVVDELPEIEQWLSGGIDYGTTNPFAGLLVGLGRDRRLYVASEYRFDSRKTGRRLSDRQYSEGVRGWLDGFEHKGVRGARPRFVFVDPSAASFRVQLHRDGLTNYPGDNGVADGLRSLSSLFAADKIRIHRSCVGLIGEIPSYSWDAKAAAAGRDEPVKENDHSCDALRYAVRTSEALWYQRVYGRPTD